MNTNTNMETQDVLGTTQPTQITGTSQSLKDDRLGLVNKVNRKFSQPFLPHVIKEHIHVANDIQVWWSLYINYETAIYIHIIHNY